MSIATRTPEGLPHRCPVCGKEASLAPSDPLGDSVCPSCGTLLSIFRDYLGRTLGIEAPNITLATRLADTGLDSLDVVELIMELEANFDLHVPQELPESTETFEDLLRWLQRLREEQGEQD